MKCATCNGEVRRVTCKIDPRRAALEFRADCAHEMTADEARIAWRAGLVSGPVPQIHGAALVAAERARQVEEEGHTAAADAELDGSELAWACWALIDAALSGRQIEQAPPVWPERFRDRWPEDKSTLRLLIIAGSMLVAEIDRRLSAGETP